MLRSFDDIGPGKRVNPESEQGRLNYYSRRLRWWQGNYQGIIPEDISTLANRLNVNWFRRVATFYPQTMFSERPLVIVDNNNDAFQRNWRDDSRKFWRSIQSANVDAHRFGDGVVYFMPERPNILVRANPSFWFQVANEIGDVVGDIIIQVISSHPNDIARVYKKRFNEPIVTRSVYELNNSQLQATLEGEQELPSIPNSLMGTSFQLAVDGQSLFDRIETKIGSLNSVFANLREAIRKNLYPNMYGPRGAVVTGADGKSSLVVQGQYFPLDQNDQPPGYIQWDLPSEILTQFNDRVTEAVLTEVGLSTALFDPSIATGVLSGEALRRINLPFVFELNNFKEINNEFLTNLIVNWTTYRQLQSLPALPISSEDIEIDWQFLRLFSEDTQEELGTLDRELGLV